LLTIPTGGESGDREKIVAQLDDLLHNDKRKQDDNNIVLMIDEAQILLHEDHNGFAYSCILWWLRMKRGRTKVVGVFAGTNASLGKLYVGKRPHSTGTSRDPQVVFWNDGHANKNDGPIEMYSPFVVLSSVGLYGDADIWKKEASCDLERCCYYGRPLFPVMLNIPDPQTGETALVISQDDTKRRQFVYNPRLFAILKRMMLNELQGEWAITENSILSILGTRVQLGISTSGDFIRETAAKGYSYLVDASAPKTGGNVDWLTSQVAFLPEPLCAGLAMGMMRKEWKLSATPDGCTQHEYYQGLDPTFWSNEAGKSFAKRLFIPEKGDAGEVMVALYMLFCGDELRQELDWSMRTFQVPFSKFMERMSEKSGSNPGGGASTNKAEMGKYARNNKYPEQCFVNFVQICRNYFRSNSWLTSEGLQYLFEAGIASYTYPGCPAVDIVAPIRILVGGNPNCEYFHPLLVSVKSWSQICSAQAQTALDAMEKLLECKRPEGGPTAFCLLVIVGVSAKSLTNITLCHGNFPETDGYDYVVIPPGDEFDVANSLLKATSASSVAEIRASHYMVEVEDLATGLRKLDDKGFMYAFPLFQSRKKTKHLHDG
jgi:hypothetical protein